MAGDNCAVFGCGSCRRTKGIGIWKLPAAKDEAHKKWRDDWLSEITKTREIDHFSFMFYFIFKCSSNGENDEEETTIRRHTNNKHAKEKSRVCKASTKTFSIGSQGARSTTQGMLQVVWWIVPANHWLENPERMEIENNVRQTYSEKDCRTFPSPRSRNNDHYFIIEEINHIASGVHFVL